MTSRQAELAPKIDREQINIPTIKSAMRQTHLYQQSNVVAISMSNRTVHPLFITSTLQHMIMSAKSSIKHLGTLHLKTVFAAHFNITYFFSEKDFFPQNLPPNSDDCTIKRVQSFPIISQLLEPARVE